MYIDACIHTVTHRGKQIMFWLTSVTCVSDWPQWPVCLIDPSDLVSDWPQWPCVWLTSVTCVSDWPRWPVCLIDLSDLCVWLTSVTCVSNWPEWPVCLIECGHFFPAESLSGSRWSPDHPTDLHPIRGVLQCNDITWRTRRTHEENMCGHRTSPVNVTGGRGRGGAYCSHITVPQDSFFTGCMNMWKLYITRQSLHYKGTFTLQKGTNADMFHQVFNAGNEPFHMSR